MSQDNKTQWIKNQGDGFGELRSSDDFLHREGNPAGASATETYYFGFHVAEAAIHGYVYLWFHPNLGTVTAACMITQGFRSSTLGADFSDIRAYLAIDEHVCAETGRMSFPNGLTLTPLEPMRRWHVTLEDRGTGTAFDLHFDAAQPPVIRADQKHLDQNMHVTGQLTLRGQQHSVDCHQVRDRSWQNLRAEDPMPVPPYDWLTVTQGSAFSMNLSIFDDLGVLGNPGGHIHVPPVQLQDGWVCIGDKPRRIVSATKRTERCPTTLSPRRHELVVEDDQGERYELVGEAIGSGAWAGWPNMLWHQNLMRWTCNGKAALGESQEVHWHEFIYRLQTARQDG